MAASDLDIVKLGRVRCLVCYEAVDTQMLDKALDYHTGLPQNGRDNYVI